MARDNEPGMGKAKGATNGSGKWSKYNGSAATEAVSWAKVDTSAVLDALVAITDAGGALLLGKTRDGGSFAITVCQGDERGKFYATTAAECIKHLAFIAENA